MIKFHVEEKRPFFTGKFWPEGVSHQLEYNFSLTLPEMLNNTVAKYPHDPAFWFLETFMTYSQLKDYVDRFATTLDKLGITKGDVVAIYLPNSFQYIISYYAITTLGAIATGINSTYKHLELLQQVKLTGAKSIIVLDVLYDEYLQKIIDKWEFSHIIHTNIVDLASGMSKLKKYLGKLLKKIPQAKVSHPKAISFVECLKSPPNVPKIEINAEIDTATLIMTGGTTGVPKAADLSHLNVVANAQQANEFITNHKDPNSNVQLGHLTGLIGLIPLFHSYAHSIAMNAIIAVGAWGILFPRPPPIQELLKTIASLPNYNYFILPGVEILFQRIADLPRKIIEKYDFKKYLKLCISSAGPLHDYVRSPFEEKTKTKLTELYGLTEASPGVSANNFYGLRESGTLGVPLPGTDWEIFSIEDFNKGPISKIGEDGTGEICICGPQVMKGYWNNPERTIDTIKEWDGRKWLLTGDIGYMDEDGRIIIRDRKKQLIKIAGHSVFPKEVESIIGNHPKVLEVAIAGLPDRKTGEAVKAWISLKPEAIGTITTEELRSWCLDKMSKWKIPKYMEFIREVPKNVIGKIMRRTLQENDPLYQPSFD